MSYLEAGFTKQLYKASAQSRPGVYLEDVASQKVSQVSGDSIIGGKAGSRSGNFQVNWAGEYLLASDGAVDRVKVGFIAEEDTYGLVIKDAQGNTIISTTGFGAGTVGTTELADGAVGESNIGDGAVSNAKISGVSVNKLLAGDLLVTADIGNPTTGYTRLDGENNRIIVNDGSDDRIVIGNI